MHTDKEDTYIWASKKPRSLFSPHFQPLPYCLSTNWELALINAFEVVFYSLSSSFMCLAHQQVIVTKLDKSLISHINQEKVSKIWNPLAQASTKHEYEVLLKCLEYFLSEKAGTFFHYIVETWLIFKEKFFSHWDNQNLHFGNNSSYNLLSFLKHLNPFLQNQPAKLTVNIGAGCTKHLIAVPTCFS